MNDISKFTIGLCLALTSITHAQSANEGFIMEAEGIRHLITHQDAIYPPLAKVAHMQGSVLLHAFVDEKGFVTKVDVLGGPPMLRNAATDAVRHWTYTPFEKDGKPVAVKVVVSVPFSLGIPADKERSDDEIGQAFFPKADQCRAANASSRWHDAIIVCGELVTIAGRFRDPSSRSLEIMDAHRDYGESLAFSGNMPEALAQFRIATASADVHLKHTDDELGAVYYWQAFAEHASHMLLEAEHDYTISESAFRQAIVTLPEMKTTYIRHLAHTLAFHSVLAEQMGDTDRMKALRSEAVSLDPHALDGLPGTK